MNNVTFNSLVSAPLMDLGTQRQLLPDNVDTQQNSPTVSLYFAVAYCCMHNCELQVAIGVWDMVLYGKGNTTLAVLQFQ